MTIRFYRTQEEYGAFSNFSAHPIHVDGQVWPTSEHYFQAMKFPHDPERQSWIRAAKTPGQSKRRAWAKGAVIRDDWDTHRIQAMLNALRAKFTQHPSLRELLLSTGTEELVEHSHRDRYWGDGGDGTGQNMLGKLLMQVRDEWVSHSRLNK